MKKEGKYHFVGRIILFFSDNKEIRIIVEFY